MKKKAPAVAFALLAAAVLAAVIIDFCNDDKNEYEFFAMNSFVELTLYGADDSLAQSVEKEIRLLDENMLSRFAEDSELYKLNGSSSANLSEELFGILSSLSRISADTGGAFDITLGAVTSLWNFDVSEFSLPDAESVRLALASSGADKLVLENGTAELLGGAQLDLGAAGKGIACDKAYEIIASSKARAAVISVGGTIGLYGEANDSRGWSVGIRTPESGVTKPFMSVFLPSGSFVSTSGGYEKCAVIDSRTYHHIISPQTGYPAESGLMSVTVIADSAMCADALSTALFVSGVDNCLETLEKYNAEAVFVFEDKTVRVTAALADSCELLSQEYALGEPIK